MITIDLTGEVVLVTGAGGSIGGASAESLAKAGAALIVADVQLDSCEQIADHIVSAGGRAVPVALDVRDLRSIEDALRFATAELGSLTGLVNAAGIIRAGAIEAMDENAWKDINDVNVGGTFLATKAAIPLLKKSGRGTIVNISSVSAFNGTNGGSAYAATKGAVLSFTYASAGELAEHGIRVNAVCPGWVDGGFTHQAMAESENPDALYESARRMHYLNRMAAPSDIGNAVTWLFSELASFVTGTAIFVDGGFMIKRT